jgi:pantoate--beta-alanine ligase
VLYLGHKDLQQARIVQSMVHDLDLSARVIVAPTVRERDGLALSSRNVYLSPAERARAGGMIRAMREGREVAREGVHDARKILARVHKVLRREASPDRVDYLALVDSATLLPIARLDKSGGFLIAAIRIGRTRLIDNLFVKPRARGGKGK